MNKGTIYHKPQRPRTQKAKSVFALQAAGYCTPLLWKLIQTDADIGPILKPQFARPCPFDGGPKHGYIDSQIIHNEEELRELWKKVQADDSQGEILLMDPIDADFNLLLTPSLMVIGPGHDGATAGKRAMSIPVAQSQLATHFPCADAGIDLETHDPYLEVVGQKCEGSGFKYFFTQLRSGPKLERKGTGDFIPHEVIVGEVLEASSDFKDREWERKIEDVKDHPGLVVWHPGGALTDHFSIHARTFNIPVVYGSRPVIGAVLSPQQIVEEPDPTAVLRGIVAGLRTPLWHSTNGHYGRGGLTEPATLAALMSLHHSSVMTGTDGDLIGIGIGFLMRLGCIALHGEARHRIRGGEITHSGSDSISRVHIYSRRYKTSPHMLRAQLSWLINVFRYGRFTSTGIGGTAWAACGKALIPLWEKTRQLALNPTSDNVRSLVRSLNIAINQAHNGGWWLNKFADESGYIRVPKGHPIYLIPAGLAYWHARTWIQNNEALLQADIERIQKWPETKLHVPRIKSVNILFRDGIDALKFEIKTPFLRGSIKQISTNAGAIKQLLEDGGCSIYMVSTDDGRLQIEGRMPGSARPVMLWGEPNLDEVIKATAEKYTQIEDEEEE